jgi:hypothetical protein
MNNFIKNCDNYVTFTKQVEARMIKIAYYIE